MRLAADRARRRRDIVFAPGLVGDRHHCGRSRTVRRHVSALLARLLVCGRLRYIERERA